MIKDIFGSDTHQMDGFLEISEDDVQVAQFVNTHGFGGHFSETTEICLTQILTNMKKYESIVQICKDIPNNQVAIH